MRFSTEDRVMFFKKRVTQDEYSEVLIGLTKEITKFVGDELRKKVEFQNANIRTFKEIIFFGSWIMTISLPPGDDKIRDNFLISFAERLEGSPLFENENREEILFEIYKRYRNYFEVFNLWRKNPQRGYLIGGAMIETIKNNNPDYKGIPIVGDTEAMKAFILFEASFMLSLRLMKKLNKKIKIVD